jgi:hypothetical protein
MFEDGTRDVRQLVHDLRNHLFVITLGLQALELEGKPERLAELLRKIRKEVTAAENIADALQGVEPDSPEP